MIEVPTREYIDNLFATRKTKYATVAFVDLQGQLRGKTVNAKKLKAGFPVGVPFAPLNMMLDFGDHPLFPAGYLNPDQDIGDNECDVDWQQPHCLPFEDEDADLLFFAEFADNTQGALWDPRRLYRHIQTRAADMGFTPVYGLEYEYRLLQETPETLRDKNFSDIKLISDTSNYGGVMHQSVWSDFFKSMRGMCEKMNVDVASMHWEVAASMGEVALLHEQGTRALDNAIMFKTHAKVLAKHHNLTMTFMAKPLADHDGQSGHIHLSLLDRQGDNAFYDETAAHGMSSLQHQFIAGVQKYLSQWLLMLAPNVNSFKRLVPGAFAPTSADWGIDNRTTALRVIPGSANSQRLELRVPGSDSNPYLAASCLLAAGLEGIAQKLSPTPAVTGASHMRKDKPSELAFPANFMLAAQQFQQSEDARRVFGGDFVDMFAGSRLAQDRAFARMVTSNELQRFLELT